MGMYCGLSRGRRGRRPQPEVSMPLPEARCITFFGAAFPFLFLFWNEPARAIDPQ